MLKCRGKTRRVSRDFMYAIMPTEDKITIHSVVTIFSSLTIDEACDERISKHLHNRMEQILMFDNRLPRSTVK